MQNLLETIRSLLSQEQGISEKKMFGGVCIMHRGNMLCGADNRDFFMVRVGKEQYEEALQREHARAMDFTGRPLRGMVYVDVQSRAELAEWLEMGLAFTRTLPKKG